MFCEICENKKAVRAGLCECCAEGISRLANLQSSVDGQSQPIKVRCHKCQLICRDNRHYLNHNCESRRTRQLLYRGPTIGS
jgi:hypothetical protein